MTDPRDNLHDAETDIRPNPLEQGDATELFGETAADPDTLAHVFGEDGVYDEHSEQDRSENEAAQ